MTENPLSAAQTFGAASYGPFLQWGDDGALYFSGSFGGRSAIVRRHPDKGHDEGLTIDPTPQGSIGYGGCSFAVGSGQLVYAGSDRKVHRIDLATGEQKALTPVFEGLGGCVVAPGGKVALFLGEADQSCGLYAVATDGSGSPQLLTPHRPWFAFNATVSADGEYAAWHEWDRHSMPWDDSRVVIARWRVPLTSADSLSEALPLTPHQTLEEKGSSFSSPKFAPSGHELAYLSDAGGCRQLYVTGLEGEAKGRALTPGEGEVGGPDWVCGLQYVSWHPSGQKVVVTRQQESTTRVVAVDRASGELTTLPTPAALVDGLAAGERFLAVGYSTPTDPGRLVLHPWDQPDKPRTIASALVGLPLPDLADAQHFAWEEPGGDGTITGILYEAEGDGPRPTIVSVHGGPTGAARWGWNTRAQFFASRGYNWLEVNHRGSTGRGKAFQRALNGQWGVLDVADARSGAEALVAAGKADPKKLVIMGGSAGGYSTMMAVTQHGAFWAAGVSLYGIGDLYDLSEGSHRFEQNYNDLLLGPLPEAGPLWRERSPLTHIKKVTTPVLLFHGTEDKAVPHQQSVDFEAALKKQGVPCQLVSFEGEGHGFRKRPNQIRLLEETARFLKRYVLCQQTR